VISSDCNRITLIEVLLSNFKIFCMLLCYCRFITMRWKLILPFITRSQILISTHHVSSLPHPHRSGFWARAACNCCGHTVGCNLNTKLALVNTSSITGSRSNLPLHFTHVCARGYAKGKARGGDKKNDKGITCTWLLIYQFSQVWIVRQMAVKFDPLF
jgi:hypothetical protein